MSKTFLFQAIQFIQTLLIQPIKFSISTVLYITIQFSVSRISMSKIVPFQTIQFGITTQFKSKYSLIVKNISISAIQFIQTILIKIIQFSIRKDFLYTQLCQNSSISN